MLRLLKQSLKVRGVSPFDLAEMNRATNKIPLEKTSNAEVSGSPPAGNTIKINRANKKPEFEWNSEQTRTIENGHT
jgi:hypothetical protein